MSYKKIKSEESFSVFSLGRLFALLVMAIGFAWLLVPREAELVERLVEDGRVHRAVVVAEEAETAIVLPTAVAQVPEEIDASAAAVKAVFEDRGETGLNVSVLNALFERTAEPREVWGLLAAQDGIITQSGIQLHDTLGRRALAMGKPELAAEIYGAALVKFGVEASDNLLRQAVMACRYSGQPKVALVQVSKFLSERNLPFSKLPEDLRRTTIALNREVNDGSKAFDLLSEEFHQTLDPAARKQLVDLLSATAAQSGRIPDSLPMIEQFVNETEVGKVTDFRKLSRERKPHESDYDFLQYGRLLAKNYEWANRSDEAFDLYLKLAMLGDVTSIERCVTIYPWINRETEVADLLMAVVPVAGHPDYSLLLARLEASRGRLDEAERMFREELARGDGARDFRLWKELGSILNEKEDFAGAVQAYRSVLAFSPPEEGGESRIMMARLLTTIGDLDAALLVYRQLKPKEHSRKTLEDYSLLAKSMGADEDYLTAIQLKAEVVGKRAPGFYIEVADTYRDMGRAQSELETLNDGVGHFPDSNLLHLRRIDCYSGYGGKEVAFELIEKCDRFSDKRYAGRYLSLAHELGHYAEALTNLSREVNAEFEWSAEEWLDIAVLYEESGDLATALEIFRRTPGGNVQESRMRAEHAWEQGDVEAACRYQEAYTAGLTEPDYEAWTFLGDIHKALGEIDSAESAYLAALAQLKLSLESGGVRRSESASVVR